MIAFFRSLPAVLGESGWLEVALLDVGADPAAAYLSFHYNGRIYLYNSGYDLPSGSGAPGWSLLAQRSRRPSPPGCRASIFCAATSATNTTWAGRTTSSTAYSSAMRTCKGCGLRLNNGLNPVKAARPKAPFNMVRGYQGYV